LEILPLLRHINNHGNVLFHPKDKDEIDPEFIGASFRCGQCKAQGPFVSLENCNDDLNKCKEWALTYWNQGWFKNRS